MPVPKIYMPTHDEVREVDQAWVDQADKVSRRQNNRNLVIKWVSNLNVTDENDMRLLVKIANMLEK